MRSPREDSVPQPPGDRPARRAPGAYHVPVLLDQTIAFVRPRAGGVYVDGTLGGGGHAEALLRQSAPDGVVIGIDRDPEALAAARERLGEFGDRLRAVHSTFDRVAEVVREQGFATVDGVLFDLGVSSRQLDKAERGFSFAQDAPLDMRMNPVGSDQTAAEVVNTTPQQPLERMIGELGEERFAGRISRAIVREREKAPIETTGRLAAIIAGSVPAAYRHGRIHPATRTFQGLRIFVNRELELLESGLRNAVDVLGDGGIVAAISYHSLEDRIVKNTFRDLAGKGRPAGEGPPPVLRILTPKPVVADPEEVSANPRARSAKLRAAERLGPSN